MHARGTARPADVRRHRVLWDGDCGLCAAWAAWVVRRDSARAFLVVPWQGCPGVPPDGDLARACRRSVQVIARDGRRLQRARAVVFVLGELARSRRRGWRRIAAASALAALAAPPAVWALDLGYRAVAARRGSLSAWMARRGWIPSACAVGARRVVRRRHELP